MKTFLALLAIVAATLVVTPHATACDGVAALGTGCYSQAIRQNVIVERQYVPAETVIVEKQIVPQKIIQRQKVVIQRQRAYPVRSQIVARLAAPRAKVIQRQRIVERSVY